MSSQIGSSTTNEAPVQFTGETGETVPTMVVGDAVTKIDLRTIEGISDALAIYAQEHRDDEPGASSTNTRRLSHSQGKADSRLNGTQPIFALLGYNDIRTLEGRLLTIVDATFHDPQQRKAFKDLVRKEIWFNWAPYLDTDAISLGMPNPD